ncbi:MAG: PIG-L family deacetylase [Planctomycetaceae bacterium]|jgi:glucosamine-6-phosphate deaminase|nr:PIG-L family deacetylase [Planctomycetaceae bacterium]
MPEIQYITSATAKSVGGTDSPCYVFDSSDDAAKYVARQVANIIRERNALGHTAVLGLVAGSTPTGVYRELIRLHKEEHLDFSRVMTFNITEYYGLEKGQQQSHAHWMEEVFFKHVNVPAKNIHVFDTTIPAADVKEHCRWYEDKINQTGSFDLLILGIGANGSIGFNEPYTSANSKTRLATLDPITRIAAASDFFSESNVPLQGFTVGMKTILGSKKIFVLAFGDHKAKMVKAAVESPQSDEVPASRLREHSDISFLLDKSASERLTAMETPWTVESVPWTDEMTKRAVLWLGQRTQKALLKLDDADFRAYGLHQLLRLYGPAQVLCNKVFMWLSDTLEYHPAGKTPKKRILCFSPHPDDDVISMGGTMIRLVEDGHEVHVAYMTSGNIAVHDHDVIRVSHLFTELCRHFDISGDKADGLGKQVLTSLDSKKPGLSDSEAVLNIKRLIRWSEAQAAAKACGCKEEYLHFLDLPFYRTGTISKKPAAEEDHQMVRQCIESVNPQQIYVPGDMTDPHGTHRVCSMIILHILQQMQEEGTVLPEVLIYRGAWQEWPVDQIELAVPLSPGDLEKKKSAIFRHESQKDRALFPGSDVREFWQRAEERNRSTANTYNQIGLPEFYALEAFVRWNGTFDF